MGSLIAPSMAFREIDWTFDQPAQVNDSSFNANREGASSQWFGKFSAKVTLKTIETEALFCPIRSFLMRAQSPNNSFRIPATVEAQNDNRSVTVASTAPKGSVTLNLSGTATALLNGQMVTVNGQLLQLTNDQAGSRITFEPPLRGEATAGTKVETANPYAVVFIPDGFISWSVSPPQRCDASFGVEETAVPYDDPPPAMFGGSLTQGLASLNLSSAGALKITGSLAETLASATLSAAATVQTAGFVSYAEGHRTTTPISQTVSMPAGFQAGDIAFAHCHYANTSGAPSFTSTSGWTQILANAFNSPFTNDYELLFWKLCDGTETSFTLSTSSGGITILQVALSVWHGYLQTGTPYEAFAHHSGNSASPSGNTITTLGANRTVINFYSNDSANSRSFGGGGASGWTDEYNLGVNDRGWSAMSHKDQATAGSVTAESRSLSLSNEWQGFTLALIKA